MEGGIKVYDFNPIAESNNYIVLDKYSKIAEQGVGYQTEANLERELVQDLVNQGYDFLPDVTSPDQMLANARVQLQTLNHVQFSESEWIRFCDQFLDKPSDNYIDKTRKIHNDYVYDFVFDDGHIQNIYLVDKKILPIIKCRLFRNLNKKERMRIDMMLPS